MLWQILYIFITKVWQIPCLYGIMRTFCAKCVKNDFFQKMQKRREKDTSRGRGIFFAKTWTASMEMVAVCTGCIGQITRKSRLKAGGCHKKGGWWVAASGKWTCRNEYSRQWRWGQLSAALWLVLSSLLYSLQLQTGSFPKPLTAEEERQYLQRSAAGDLQARNILIERNLRLVAHIMKNGWCARKLPVEDTRWVFVLWL